MDRMKSIVSRNKTPLREFAGHCGLSCMIAVLLILALLGLFTAIRVNIDMPFFAHQPVTTIIAAGSALLAAYMVGRKRKKTGLVLGACTGIVMFGLIAVFSAILRNEPATGQIFVKLVALISAGGIGGLIGVSKKAKPKKIKTK